MVKSRKKQFHISFIRRQAYFLLIIHPDFRSVIHFDGCQTHNWLRYPPIFFIIVRKSHNSTSSTHTHFSPRTFIQCLEIFQIYPRISTRHHSKDMCSGMIDHHPLWCKNPKIPIVIRLYIQNSIPCQSTIFCPGNKITRIRRITIHIALFSTHPKIFVRSDSQYRIIFSCILYLQPAFSGNSPQPSTFSCKINNSFIRRNDSIYKTNIITNCSQSAFLQAIPE